MVKDQKEHQVLDLIKKSKTVLVCLPEQPTTDAMSAGLALLTVVEKLDKDGKVVSSGFQLPINHSFLPRSEEIFNDLSAIREFVVSLDISNTRVQELSYEIENNRLNFHIKPKDGVFTPNDVTAKMEDYTFDLVIVVDTQDLEQLGQIYEHNTDFFYQTPVVNIDHDPANDNFGQVNVVNVTATSTSEVVFEMIKDWGDDLLDEFMATNLLSGMISKTRSFKSGAITPRSLAIASHLIDHGARREEIVKNLYQSKKVSTLKLWGRALTRLESDSEHHIVWSILADTDITSVGAEKDDLPDVIDELIINTPEAKNVFLLITGKTGVHGYISTAPYLQAKELFADWKPRGTAHFIDFHVQGKSASEVQHTILTTLKEHSAPQQ